MHSFVLYRPIHRLYPNFVERYVIFLEDKGEVDQLPFKPEKKENVKIEKGSVAVYVLLNQWLDISLKVKCVP